jgi:hypothetical protein
MKPTVCNVATGGDCFFLPEEYHFCDKSLACYINSSGFSGTCKAAGVVGQACNNFFDCFNITGARTSCVNSSCLESYYLGVGESCTTDHSCVTSVCLNGKCNESATGCISNDYCPYNYYCDSTSTPKKCLPKKAVGGDCTEDAECPHLVECVNKKCVTSFTLTEGQLCSSSSQCSGCMGCTNVGKNTGNCTSALTKIQTFGITCTDDANCTGIGDEKCVCDYASSSKKCVVTNPVASFGDCKKPAEDYVACIKQNQCPIGGDPSNVVAFSASSSTLSCAYKCKAQADCLARCSYDLYTKNFPIYSNFLGCTTAPTCTANPTATCYGGGTPGGNGVSLAVTVLFILVAMII